MRRVVSVWFPTLPTDRLRRPEESQGSALDPQRGHAPFDPTPLSHGSKGHGPWRGSGQRPDLLTLAEWCLHYAPLTAPDPPDGVW
ncbi:MAG: hypothetical protein QOD93_4947, partial [Acetobacteraceae bacterium]|nr:hypothetical protein [Acetobacteraceae bacterium]